MPSAPLLLDMISEIIEVDGNRRDYPIRNHSKPKLVQVGEESYFRAGFYLHSLNPRELPAIQAEVDVPCGDLTWTPLASSNDIRFDRYRVVCVSSPEGDVLPFYQVVAARVEINQNWNDALVI